jgi:NADPH2:quinone reductase
VSTASEANYSRPRGGVAGGSLSLVGAAGVSDVRFDAFELILPVTLTGYSSETLNGEQSLAAITALAMNDP